MGVMRIFYDSFANSKKSKVIRPQEKQKLHKIIIQIEAKRKCNLSFSIRKFNTFIYLFIININKEGEETLGSDGYVYGIDYGDDLTSIYLPANSSRCTHYICTTFSCQSYLNKLVKNVINLT